MSVTNLMIEIDLTTLVPTLDNTASEIITYQRDSTVQRKDLAQKTKDFRKLDDSAKLVEVKGLLKGRRTTWLQLLHKLIWQQRIKHSSTSLRITRNLQTQPSSKSIHHCPKHRIHIPYSKRPSTLCFSQRTRCLKSHQRTSIYRRVLAD